jgi:D-3-phosphoglycerate dehydrogenase/glyoxylate/hydroxypyruvate reductase A
VAQAVARGLLALGLPVALWGRGRRDLPGLAPVTRWAGDDELPALLASSNVLVNTLPLTPLTAGLLCRETLSQLPQGAFLVNVGRGEHVVEPDLRTLLDSGHLAGAALDVLQREPPSADHWTWHHPKVVATPHIAGEARAELVAAQCLAALQAARAGTPIAHTVNRRAGY